MNDTSNRPETRRVALLLEYDGSFYAGWQRQANAETVQSAIESALDRLVQAKCIVTGSGRTDAGVHGRGQVAHTDIPASVRLSEEKFARALNAHLPRTIRIRAVRFVENSFQARFDAMRREYRYTVIQEFSVFRARYAWHVHKRINAALLAETADLFRGTHNFTTFSKHNPTTANYICAVEQCSWSEVERGVWQFTIVANRFVYGMVRCLVGASIDAASGKRTLDDIRSAFLAEDRHRSSPLAPAEGLILWRVNYPDDPFADEYLRGLPNDIAILG